MDLEGSSPWSQQQATLSSSAVDESNARTHINLL